MNNITFCLLLICLLVLLIFVYFDFEVRKLKMVCIALFQDKEQMEREIDILKKELVNHHE